MIHYDFIACAKRMGTVLVGRTEPSVDAVKDAAEALTVSLRGDEVGAKVGIPLRALYHKTIEQPVPIELTKMLERLDVKEKRSAAH